MILRGLEVGGMTFDECFKCLKKGMSKRRKRRNLKAKKASALVYKTQGTENLELQKLDTNQLKDLQDRKVKEEIKNDSRNLFGNDDDEASMMFPEEMLSLSKLPSLGYSRTKSFKRVTTNRVEKGSPQKNTKKTEKNSKRLCKDESIANQK